MLSYRFVSEQLHNGSYVRRPKVKVLLAGPNASMQFLALLDSGTDVTIIPRSIADFLGLQYDPQSSERFLGFSNESFQCAPSELTVVFLGTARRQDEKLLNVPVLVALSGEEKEPVLGCSKIFESLKITFDKGRKIQISRKP